MASSDNKKILKDIAAAIELFPGVVARKKRAYKRKQAILKRFGPVTRKLAREEAKKTKAYPHPWRLCPPGQHWVSEHPMHVPVSVANPGGITTRRGHCRANPSHQDQLYTDEMIQIASEHFHDLKVLPSSNPLGFEGENDFDLLIAGWTQYWNEVLRGDPALDPNLVKALISTESGFKVKSKAKASPGNWARGLMQVTDETIKILRDEKGELKDHLINMDQADLNDPNLNIAAGIRWLFHKKRLLEKRQKRSVSWEEAAMEYKAYTKEIREKKPRALKQLSIFRDRYKTLTGEND